jgi:hypothetical protein
MAEEIKLTPNVDMQMLIVSIMPNTKYFDSRFDLLQVQRDGLQKGQHNINGRLDYFKQNVDKKFEQVIASIDKFGDKMDGKDEKQRSFTMRMFFIAISIFVLGVLGVFLKTLGIF